MTRGIAGIQERRVVEIQQSGHTWPGRRSVRVHTRPGRQQLLESQSYRDAQLRAAKVSGDGEALQKRRLRVG